MIRVQRLRARQRSDDGVGLPELLVSMIVFAIVMAAVVAVFTNTIDIVRFVSTKTSTTADASIAMEAMTRSIRVAVIPTGESAAIVSAQPGRLVFYSSLNRGAGQTGVRPTRVTYAYNAGTGCLQETQVPATDSAVPGRPFVWTSAGTTKCLIRTAAAPEFVFFADGRVVGSDGTTPVAPLPMTAGVLPADSLDDVVSIQMSLTVTDPAAVDVRGTRVTDRVTLANVLFGPSTESD